MLSQRVSYGIRIHLMPVTIYCNRICNGLNFPGRDRGNIYFPVFVGCAYSQIIQF